MAGIEQVFQVHRAHAADDAGGDELLHLGAEGGPAVVEGDAHAAAGAGDGGEDGAALGGVDGEGFFGDDVAAGVERAHDVVGVGGVGGADEDGVGAVDAQQLVVSLRRIRRHGGMAERVGEQRVVVGHARGAGVAKGDQLDGVAVGRRHRFDEGDGAAAGADEGVAGPGRGGGHVVSETEGGRGGEGTEKRTV